MIKEKKYNQRMDKLIISGKEKLEGSINVHGSKNSSLPILVSSLLSRENLNLLKFLRIKK